MLELGPMVPLFGVCMGLQCIGEAFGGLSSAAGHFDFFIGMKIVVLIHLMLNMELRTRARALAYPTHSHNNCYEK